MRFHSIREISTGNCRFIPSPKRSPRPSASASCRLAAPLQAMLGSLMASAFVAALILCLLAACAAPAERLPVRLFTSIEGLARDSLHCVLSDADGFLWFCTGEGISRYNGYGFRTWRTSDGLPDRDVRAMIASRDGGFWVGTGAGLARFNPSVQRQERFARDLLARGPTA